MSTKQFVKNKLGATNCLYPMPAVLVGVNDMRGKANYITIAHLGIMNFGSISLSINNAHYTNEWIKSNGTFSINIPSVDMVEKTDYCGLVSGKYVDKDELFEKFYGELGSAPMIRECPLNMECRLSFTASFRTYDLFIGKIVQTYCDDRCLTENVVDFSKVNPILFVKNDYSYWTLGERFAKAFNVGKTLKKSG